MPFPIRKVSAEEQESFLKALSVPFCTDPTPGWTERFQIALAQADLYSAFDGGRMISTFGSYDLSLTVPGGHSVPMAGTTLVTVLPTHRRQGVLRSHMIEHFREAYETGRPLAGLWASESSIYGRFGYGPATESSRITIDKRHAKLQTPADIRGSMRLVEIGEALEVFPGIYDRVATRRAGMFPRTPVWWKLRNLADPEELRRGATSQRLVLYEPKGRPSGYAIFRTQTDFKTYTNELLLIELIGLDAGAQRALWQFLFGVDLIAQIRYWNLPIDDPLLWWLEQPREAKRTPSDAVWVRLVNLIEALNRRAYSTAGRIVFRFRDELCPWNDGVFQLETGSDGVGRCEPATDSPELELTPFTLGAVYLGGHRVRALADAGLINGSPETIHLADAIFSWPTPPWCQEIF